MSRAGLIKRVSLARQADSSHLINGPLEGTCHGRTGGQAFPPVPISIA